MDDQASKPPTASPLVPLTPKIAELAGAGWAAGLVACGMMVPLVDGGRRRRTLLAMFILLLSAWIWLRAGAWLARRVTPRGWFWLGVMVGGGGALLLAAAFYARYHGFNRL